MSKIIIKKCYIHVDSKNLDPKTREKKKEKTKKLVVDFMSSLPKMFLLLIRIGKENYWQFLHKNDLDNSSYTVDIANLCT